MNNKAESNTFNNVLHLIVLAVFIVGVFAFVSSQLNGARVWEDYYAKEIVKVINLAKPGDVIELNIHKGTEVAKKNKVESYSDLFMVDNTNNEVCVKLNNIRRTCYSYFNDVFIDNMEVRLGVPGNILRFEVKEEKNE